MENNSFKALKFAAAKFSYYESDLMEDCPSSSEYYKTIKNFECIGHWLFITIPKDDPTPTDEEGEVIAPDLLLIVEGGEEMIWAYCLDECDNDSFNYIGE